MYTCSTGMSPLSERKQHLNRKLNWTSLSLDTWFWEWLSIAFSVLCFIATVGLLLAYHNSPSPNLPHGLTLNTIVSVLATASKASLLLTIGTSIGQLKWIWFQQDSKRQLYNLQSFDDASRGPLGSLKILFQRPQQGRLLLSLAAVVTLLALAFDPFMQQIVSYPVREVPSLTAKATTKQAMLPFEPPTFGADDNDFFNAMNAGLWSGNFTASADCPSGNCTWPPFTTAGWCSKCEDVTSSARLVGCNNITFSATVDKPENISCNVSLPHGAWASTSITIQKDLYELYYNDTRASFKATFPHQVIWAVNQEMADLLPGSGDLPGNYLGVDTPIAVLAHAELLLPKDIAWPHKSSYPKMNLPVEDLTQLRINKVTQCVISPCVRTHSITVSGGKLSINNDTINFGRIFNHNYTIDPPYISSHDEFYANGTATCWSPSTTPNNNNPPQNQNMTLLSLDRSPMREDRLANPDAFAVCPITGFYDYLTTLLESSVNITYSSTNRTSWGYLDIAEASPSMERVLTSDLQSIAADIAASLTRYSHERSNRTVEGRVFVPRVYVAVAWGFLALPAVVIALGTVVLVSTVLVQGRLCTRSVDAVALWKSSLLPLLYHGLDNGNNSNDGGGDDDDDDDDDDGSDSNSNERTQEYPTISSMEEAARLVEVRLGSHPGVNGLRLVE